MGVLDARLGWSSEGFDRLFRPKVCAERVLLAAHSPLPAITLHGLAGVGPT